MRGRQQNFVQGADLQTSAGWQAAAAPSTMPATPAQQDTMGDSTTGLTQQLAPATLTAPPGLQNWLPSAALAATLASAPPTSASYCTRALPTAPLGTPPAMAPSATPIAMARRSRLQAEIMRLSETDVLEDADLIQACCPNAPHPNFAVLDNSTSENIHHDILQLLVALAFNIQHESPFARLGFSEIDGPAPTTARIEHRRRLAQRIITHWAYTEDDLDAQATLYDIHHTCDTCIELLPEILLKRKALRGSARNTLHWWELAPASLNFISDYVSTAIANIRVATQLSNIHKQGFTDKVADVEETRTVGWMAMGMTLRYRLGLQIEKGLWEECSRNAYMFNAQTSTKQYALRNTPTCEVNAPQNKLTFKTMKAFEAHVLK